MNEAVKARVAMRLMAVSAIADALGKANVRWAALKGMDLAFRAYATPSERDMSDVDVLVDPARFDDALAALSALERDHDEAEHHRRLRFRIGAGATVSVELHRDLFDRPHGLDVDVPAILARAVEVVLPDRTRLPVLAPADAWVHVAGHLAWSDVGGVEVRRGLADLAALERACSLSPETCLLSTRAWRLEVAVSEVLAAIAAAGVELPSEGARRLAAEARGGGLRRRLARRVVRSRVARSLGGVATAEPASAIRALLAPSLPSALAIVWTGWRRRSARARVARSLA